MSILKSFSFSKLYKVISVRFDAGFTMNEFYVNVSKRSFKKFLKEYVTVEGEYFTSTHPLTIFRKYPTVILGDITVDVPAKTPES